MFAPKVYYNFVICNRVPYAVSALPGGLRKTMNKIKEKFKTAFDSRKIRSFFCPRKLIGGIKASLAWLNGRPFLFIAILALLMTLVIETLTRRSLAESLSFMVFSPLAFLANSLILFLLYSISLFLKKRYVLVLFFSLTWLGFAIADCVMMSFRVTPLSMNDLLIAKSVFTIIDIYLSVFQMIAICVAFLAALTLFITFIIKHKKQSVRYLKVSLTSLVTAIVTITIILSFTNSRAVAKDYAFIGNGYKKYGFTFSFCLSALDRGISKPIDYNKQTMTEVLNEIKSVKTKSVNPDTNIIFLQLESFIDVNRFDGFGFSKNPVPFFSSLKENYPHAFISVPALGAGTANTEFEVLTQMDLDFFGIGETPYKSVLQNTSCETISYVLKEIGYTCHALHNHQGTFYDRNSVFRRLGFDTFTSVEYMNNVEKNPIGFAKDFVLTNEIIRALSSTESLDFVFAISVQAHGKYPDDVSALPGQPTLTEGGEILGDRLSGFEYYLSQLEEMDEFLNELTTALSSLREKVVLVIYGDHFPGFQFSDSVLGDVDIFQTEYVVWSNYDLNAEVSDIQAYQLTSSIMSLLGYNNGFLTKYHQNYSDRENYLTRLEDIQYDMLYGDKYLTSGVNPFIPTDIQMGTKPIMIQKVEVIGEAAFITGNDFTPYSVVRVNGDDINTVFINSSTLLILAEDLADVYELTVAQIGSDKSTLSETPPISGVKD